MLAKTIARSFVAIYLGFSVLPAHALTEVHLSLSDLVERANAIVVGTVIEMTSLERFIDDKARIVTDVSIADLEVVKGKIDAAEMVVTQFGGRVGDVVEWYPGLPVFEMERRYLIFLMQTGANLLAPIGRQGLFIVERDPSRKIDVVTSANGRNVLAVRDDEVVFAVPPERPGEIDETFAEALSLEQFLKELSDRSD